MESYNSIQEFVPTILERLKNEYEAHFFYRNFSNWARLVGYKYAHEYYNNEAKDELVHARILQDFLSDHNVSFLIPNIEVSEKFDGLIDGINKQFEIESALGLKYNKNAIQAMTKSTTVYRLFSKMEKIQEISVIKVLDFINKSKLYDSNKTSIKLFEKEVFKN